MKHTDFVGLTIIEAGDSPWDDGGSFYSRSPSIIDRMLRIATVAQRHDGGPPLANPTGAPTLAALGTGGLLAPDQDVFVCYTAVDRSGGETLPSPATVATTPAGVGAPDVPTVAVDYSAGNLPANLYAYAVTVVDAANNESAPSDPVSVTVESGNANAQVIVSGLDALVAAHPGAVDWHLYRSTNGSDYGFLDAGTSASYTDNGVGCADAQLPPPDDSGASAGGGTGSANVTVPAADLPQGTVTYRIYASPTSDFPDPCLVGEFAVADAGNAHLIQSFDLATGSPPVASTAVGGAPKILATRDIDWTGYTGGGGGGGTALTIEDHGTPVIVRDTLDFTGAGVTVADDGGTGRTVVTIAGGGGGGGGGATAPLGSGFEWTNTEGQVVARLLAKDGTEQEITTYYEEFDAAGRLSADFTTGVGGTYATPNTANADLAGYRNSTGPSDPVTYAMSQADGDVVAWAGYEVLTDGWVRFGVTIGTGGLGLFGFIDRAAGVLAIRTVDTLAGGFIDVATLTVAAGWTIPVIGETGTLRFTRRNDHLTLVDDRNGGATSTVEADMPNASRAVWGSAGTGGGSVGLAARVTDTASLRSDWIELDALRVPRELHVQLAAQHSTADAALDTILLDEQGRLRIAAPVGYSGTIANPADESGMRVELTADWHADPSFHPTIDVDAAGWCHLSGVVVKNTGAAPVADEVLFTLPGKYAPSGFTGYIYPAIAGDDDGRAFGAFELGYDGSNWTARWAAGTATDPATKHPYLRLDGVSWKLAS